MGGIKGLTVIRCALCTANTALTHPIMPVPRWLLAPPPPPFALPARAPRPRRSIHASSSGRASWGGRALTVLRMSAGSLWARQVSSNRASDECNAWMSVRVSEPAGTASRVSPSSFFGRRRREREVLPVVAPAATEGASESETSEGVSSPAPVVGSAAASRWPRLSSARSASSVPSGSRVARSSVEGSSPRSNAPDRTASEEDSV